MGIIQNPKAATAKNFEDKNDYLKFMRDGVGFPMDANSLYPGLTMAGYKKNLPTLVKYSNASFRSQLTEINRLTNGQLARDFGFTADDLKNGFTDEMCQKVFMSDAVTLADVPQNEEVKYDGVDIINKCLFAITRGFHYIGKLLTPEKGWFLHVTGFESIYIISAYCNNKVDTDWIASHLVKTDVPSDDGQGNVLPKVIPCPPVPKVPIVIPCDPTTAIKAPIVINGASSTKAPVVINGTSSTVTTSSVVTTNAAPATSVVTTDPDAAY